jgi:FdrA protein
MLDGLALLGRDRSTTVVVLISKPPDPGVARRLLDHAAATGKPVVVAFVGSRPDRMGPGDLYPAVTLEEAAVLAVQLTGGASEDLGTPGRWEEALGRRAETAKARLVPSQRYLRGLYSGGTLCAECVSLLDGTIRPLYTNVPAGTARPLPAPARSQAHTVLDLGAGEFTVGRLHPMLDMTLRLQRLGQEAADPEVAVILLDVVLGEGVHPDPAGALVPVLRNIRASAGAAGRDLAVVATVCGTDADPQNRARQVGQLESVGVLIEETNARAAALAGAIVGGTARLPRGAVPARSGGRGAKSGGAVTASVAGVPFEHAARASGEAGPALLARPPGVVNVGLAGFAESLRAQGVPVIDVDWRPPAGGDRAMLDLLERLG